MLNKNGWLVSIVPTSPLISRKNAKVKEFRCEAALYNQDPLELEAGVFPTAKTTETRIIETRRKDVVNVDISHADTVRYHAHCLMITLENDCKFLSNIDGSSSKGSIKVWVNSFCNSEEAIRMNIMSSEAVMDVVSLAFSKDICSNRAFNLMYPEPSKKPVSKQLNIPSFNQLLFAA